MNFYVSPWLCESLFLSVEIGEVHARPRQRIRLEDAKRNSNRMNRMRNQVFEAAAARKI